MSTQEFQQRFDGYKNIITQLDTKVSELETEFNEHE